MTAETPAAADSVADLCSLTEASLEQRLDWIRSEILPHGISREALPDGMRFSFAEQPELAGKLELLASLESECCGGLDFEVERGSGLHLTVRGIDPGSRFFAELPGAAQPAPGGLGRLAKAGGIGVAASFFLLCVVPMALAAVAGAAVAAPLARLDSPVTLVAGSLAAGAFAWWLLRRRAASRASCGSGC